VALDKKGQIFILSSIALLLLFFVSYSLYASFSERNVVSTRVKTMDSFVFSMEQDLERQLYTTGFRVIFLAQDRIARTGDYIVDFDDFFQEAINNGTVDGEISTFLIGANISDIIDDINDRSQEMGIDVVFSDVDVSIGQEDPWGVIIYFNSTIYINDKSNLAYWNKTEVVKSRIGIEGFEDPLYFVETYGKVSRKINSTIYEGNYVSGSDKTNLSLHLSGKYYTNNSDAPSFLDRLKGDMAANENGIESFVYIPDLSAQGVGVSSGISVVDYLYFSTKPAGDGVSGLPSWFYIDDEHKDKYQIE
jgi:hypothetical protein